MPWFQQTITLAARCRGFHLITREVVNAMPAIADVTVGQLQVFIQHTSASLTINENADPDVRLDLESAINAIAPENFPYVHTLEGPDDMPAHVKSSLLGASVLVPVTEGRLNLGTWQGIFLCEHRSLPHTRTLTATINGKKY